MINSRFGHNKPRQGPKQEFYGAPVGILLLERGSAANPFDRPDPFYRPFIPGSVGNASTWSVPVRYKTIRGLTFEKLVGPDADDFATAAVQAAVELVREGAQLVTAHCGFMVRYQDAIRTAVNAPVLLSPLLLIPFLGQLLPHSRAVGVITAKSTSLTPEMLKCAGVPPHFDRLAIAGLEDAPCFAATFLTASGSLDVSRVESEVVDAAIELLERRPDIGALIFECSELPPYAAAVQRATGIPVFDLTCLVEFVISGLIRKPFSGLG